jgi:hypothetical protein
MRGRPPDMPPTLSPPRKTAIPLAFLTQTRAAQVDNASLTTTSTPPATSFLGIPTEVRYMIYGYIWTEAIDLYIDRPNRLKTNAVGPIFQVNRQVRSETIDSLRRTKSLTFDLHATVRDLNFSNTTSVLEVLNNQFSKTRNGGIIRELHVLLSLRHKDLKHPPPAPASFEQFVRCLERLGLSARYTYSSMGRTRKGVEKSARDDQITINARLRKAVYSAPGGWSPDVRDALVKMQVRLQL